MIYLTTIKKLENKVTYLVNNVEELKKNLLKVQESEKIYKSVFDNAKDAIIILNCKTEKIEDANDEALSMLGIELENIQKIHFSKLVCEEDIIKHRVNKIINNEILEPQEYFLVGKNGKKINVEAKSSLFRQKGKEVIISVFRDISNRKKIENQLKIQKNMLEQKTEELINSNNELKKEINEKIQAQKMLESQRKDLEKFNYELKLANEKLKSTQVQLISSERLSAVGLLAAGVAHEMNNPLTPVLSYATLMKHKLENAPNSHKEYFSDFFDWINMIEAGVVRCKSLADNLLTFASKSDALTTIVDIEDTINKTCDLVGVQLRKKKIKIKKNINEILSEIKGNKSQLQQVFINIILNAIDAIDTIDTINKDNKQGTIEIYVKNYEKICEIYFTDNGSGISEDNINKIFDPFFTTKPYGKGTGLGLSIAYGIIKEHGGDISVKSKQGTGTTFIITLPVIKKTLKTGKLKK